MQASLGFAKVFFTNVSKHYFAKLFYYVLSKLKINVIFDDYHRETYERQKLDVKSLTHEQQTTKRALQSKVT